MARFTIFEPDLTREEWLSMKFHAITPRHSLNKFFSLRFKKSKSEELVHCALLFDGAEFEVQKNWRACIFEDLEDGQYYYFPQYEKYNKNTVGGYGFCLSELLQEYCEIEDYPPYKIKCYRGDPFPKPIKTAHQGTFYNLVFGNRQNLDELFDSLAFGNKSIRISIVKELPVKYDTNLDCLRYQRIYSYDVV